VRILAKVTDYALYGFLFDWSDLLRSSLISCPYPTEITGDDLAGPIAVIEKRLLQEINDGQQPFWEQRLNQGAHEQAYLLEDACSSGHIVVNGGYIGTMEAVSRGAASRGDDWGYL
jgi:hypothetical protein